MNLKVVLVVLFGVILFTSCSGQTHDDFGSFEKVSDTEFRYTGTAYVDGSKDTDISLHIALGESSRYIVVTLVDEIFSSRARYAENPVITNTLSRNQGDFLRIYGSSYDTMEDNALNSSLSVEVNCGEKVANIEVLNYEVLENGVTKIEYTFLVENFIPVINNLAC